MKNQLSELRGANYKLRQELTEATTLAKLSPDQHKRYLAWCSQVAEKESGRSGRVLGSPPRV